MYGQYVYWRETMRPAKFLIFDSRVVLAIIPVLIYMRVWTFALAIISMFVFWWFDRKGIPADSILRFLRSWIIGKKRSARGLFEERTAIDFGFECQLYLENMKREELALLALSAPAKISLPSRIMAMIGFGSAQAGAQPVTESAEENERSLDLDKDVTWPGDLSSPGLLKSLLARSVPVCAGVSRKVRSVFQGIIAGNRSALSGEIGKSEKPVRSVELIRSVELVKSVNLVKSVGLENAEWQEDVGDQSGSSGISLLSRLRSGPVLIMRLFGRGLNSCFSRFGIRRKTGLKSDRDENDG